MRYDPEFEEDDRLLGYDPADEYQHEEGYCPACSGSGEGMNEKTRCSGCKGKGVI